jgi:hypothetical protein
MFYIDYKQEALFKGIPNDKIALFAARSISRVCIASLVEGIKEDLCCFFKGNTMFFYVALGFIVIPLKFNTL